MRTSLSFLLLLAVVCLGFWGSAAAASTPSGEEESAPITFPKIDRRPSEERWSRGAMESLPRYDPDSENPFQVDLRAYDVSGLDLSESLDDLMWASFDDDTTWPADERMPAGFDRERIMELGRDPGLGVRTLHERGITGRGVGVAIIDQVLLTEHEEYADRLRLYEEINVVPGTDPQMHGPAVASIAVGKTVGVAPEADLYFIASWTFEPYKKGHPRTFEYYAQAVRRILEVNEQLPDDRKIRVISISVGWNPSQKGADEMSAAAQEAVEAGMLVVCSSVDDVHGPDFKLLGLGRAPLDDPNAFESCKPWHHAAPSFYRGAPYTDWLLTPSDSRTTASPNGEDEYVFYRQGGLSWSIPYAAGVYALAAQVDPEITPERFWSLAMKTGRMIEVEHDGKKLPLGRIIDPVALIKALQGE